MANVLNRTLPKILFSRKIWNKKQFSVISCYPCISWCNSPSLEKKLNNKLLFPSTRTKYECFRYYSDEKSKGETAKLTIFQKFKQMYRDYWYVLVPVHIITSTVWFGGFYYMAKSGFDIVYILESWNVSDKVINPLRDSSMGYVAVAYACYKIATPLRYTVTLGGTTISINYLKKWGYIKPVPSKEKLKEMYQEKTKSVREGIKEKRETFMESIHETTEGIKEKKESILKTVKKTAEKKETPIKAKGKT